MNQEAILDINILEIIPQRAPMVMIDNLLYADEKKTISSFEIKTDCIFIENGFLSESGIIENIAQTAAAGFGYIDKKEGKPTAIGYIASIKDIKINQLPPVGTKIASEIVAQNKVLDFNIIQGKVIFEGTEIASCEMRIFVKP
ncbi:MAG: 3-hydroxyacyl-ACP dehydratase [Saprospirales bacterium]|nr:3-hydroxyacyl-ACP dehydratase [Saprospirales bacterium]